MHNAETANPVNWHLISVEGDCGEADCGEVNCGEADCGEAEWIPLERMGSDLIRKDMVDQILLVKLGVRNNMMERKKWRMCHVKII